MIHQRLFTKLLGLVLVLLFSSITAQATDIRGVIPTTLTIFENSRLTGDVECSQLDNGPCIRFGAPGIKLELNGFKMTGTANEPPRSSCVAGADFGAQQADGIHSNFDEVVIEGPGLVQRMRRHGIALIGIGIPVNPVEKAVVKKLVSHQNCFSGIFMGSVNNTLVEEVVSARNSSNSEARPCGGVCITNSNNNRIRRSEFFGNGSIFPGPPPAAVPNDFGVGLVGSSSGNIIEENGIGGNVNGLALFPLSAALTPTGNLIRKNVIVGNPPMEVSADNPAINPVGADIRDFSATGSNRFEENLCITYTGASPSPCLNLPQFAGHQNN